MRPEEWAAVSQVNGRTSVMFFEDGEKAAQYAFDAAKKSRHTTYLYRAVREYEPVQSVKIHTNDSEGEE